MAANAETRPMILFHKSADQTETSFEVESRIARGRYTLADIQIYREKLWVQHSFRQQVGLPVFGSVVSIGLKGETNFTNLLNMSDRKLGEHMRNEARESLRAKARRQGLRLVASK